MSIIGIICLIVSLCSGGFGIYLIVWNCLNPADAELFYIIVALILIAIAVAMFVSAIKKFIRKNAPADTYEENNAISEKSATASQGFLTTHKCEMCGQTYRHDDLARIGSKLCCKECVEKLHQTANDMHIPYKSKAVAIILCLFLGGLGLHRIYIGKTGSGLAMLTATVLSFITGLFFIVWIIVGIIVFVDIIRIASNGFTDSYGRDLV